MHVEFERFCSVWMMILLQVGPILLKCLGLTDAKPLLVALEICRRFLLAQDDFFRDHLQNVVPQCITLTTFEASLVREREREAFEFDNCYTQ